MNATQLAPATAGAAGQFFTRQVQTLLFDCPLWPIESEHPDGLVSFMTGVAKPRHTMLARALCRRAIVAQFPALVEPCGDHLSELALAKQLSVVASFRCKVLSDWLDNLVKTAGLQVAPWPLGEEILFDWADRLDWHMHDPARRASELTWYDALCRFVLKTSVTMDATTLYSDLLPSLEEMFRNQERDARHLHATWLETRRVAASLPEVLMVQPLPAGTYTEEHLGAEQEVMKQYSGLLADASRVFGAWGRLDYFRTAQRESVVS